jgi:hypothetical protein
MVKGDYSEPMNRLSLWAKDMSVITDFARDLNCPTPLFAATMPLYTAAVAMGRQAEDTAAVCVVLEAMANIRRPPSGHSRRPRRAGSPGQSPAVPRAPRRYLPTEK